MKIVGVLAAPAALALAALWLAGYLPAEAAFISALAVAAALMAVVMPRLRRLEGLLAAFGALTGQAEKRQSVPAGGPSLDELARAVDATAREWEQRQSQQEAIIAANEAVFARLPDPLIMIDRDRQIVRANPAATALFESALVGRDLVGVLRNPTVVEAVGAAIAERDGRQVEFVLPVPIERSFAARVEPLSAATADGTVALLTLHDLTAIKRADRLRADFVANASHELRTPLATLLGFIETLRGPARDDSVARDRFLAIMDGQAQRMSRLISDLLSLSRIEMNEHRQPTGAIGVGKILHAVVDSLQMRAAEKNVKFAIDGTPREVLAGGTAHAIASLPQVTGDGDELTQVFQNLLDNAIKYGRSDSTTRVIGWTFVSPSEYRDIEAPMVASRLDVPAIALSIEDEGDGIAREHLPRLTERFYRVDTARSRELGGTGLGLAIVKHILSRHRGLLDIDSTPGIGSRFTVYLPIAESDASRQ